MISPHGTQLRDAYDAAKISVPDLWLRYFALGGEASEMEVDAYLNGAMALTAFQHDMLAHAINERLDEMTPPRAPYSDAFPAVDEAEEYLWEDHRGDSTHGDV